ncbi:MAG: hypothetical protein ABJF88_12975 [Rhodothermales bacterium]
MARDRRGMLIKNLSEQSLTIRMATRKLELDAGEEIAVTAEEVRDAVLRDHLQVRTIAVVRPTTAEENDDLERVLAGE